MIKELSNLEDTMMSVYDIDGMDLFEELLCQYAHLIYKLKSSDDISVYNHLFELQAEHDRIGRLLPQVSQGLHNKYTVLLNLIPIILDN